MPGNRPTQSGNSHVEIYNDVTITDTFREVSYPGSGDFLVKGTQDTLTVGNGEISLVFNDPDAGDEAYTEGPFDVSFVARTHESAGGPGIDSLNAVGQTDEGVVHYNTHTGLTGPRAGE